MKYYSKKVLRVIMAFCLIVGMSVNVFAHPGKTDANGGHKDNKNKSGLGSYHYHCGGHPAHLHKNGVCPYDNSAETYSSNVDEVEEEEIIIEATEISINEDIDSMEVGETKKLTATILPEDTEDKSVTWKSKNDDVVSVNSEGEITALKAGTAIITVKTANGKTDTLTIAVNEVKEEVVNTVVDSTSSSEDNTGAGDGILGLGILGGAVFMGYKKYKNSKK